MKLIDALSLVQSAATSEAPPFRVVLACGFTPLHLHTFLAAHLQQRLPAHRVEIQTGVFGDLAGTMARIAGCGAAAAAVAIEWADLDPRLGVRSLGGFRPDNLPGIVRAARDRLRLLAASLGAAGGRLPIAISLPSLPLPPVATTAGWQASTFELALRSAVAEFAVDAATLPLVRVVSAQELDRRSTPAKRFDVRMEIDAGHPYVPAHADAIADLLARLIDPPPAKKGIIVDLDDTLWRGIVGEDGPVGVRWDLDGHAQVHGLIEQMLHSLADTGVLVAIASKNQKAIVDEALRRDDLLIDPAKIFPVEVHWGPKSESVRRILRAWNVGEDSVASSTTARWSWRRSRHRFRASSASSFPAAMRRLPTGCSNICARSSDATWSARRTRSGSPSSRRPPMQGAPCTRAQPRMRSSSRSARWSSSISAGCRPTPARSSSLTRPTSGASTAAARRRRRGAPGSRVRGRSSSWRATATCTVPSARFAVLRGRHLDPRTLVVDTWVMSCRAFARRVEHRCLERLFSRFEVDEIVFDYASTERNGPIREMLEALLDGAVAPGARLSRALRRALSAAVPSHHRDPRGGPLSTVEDRLAKCLRRRLPRLSPEEIVRANINSVGAWDSLATLTLTSLIEEEFSISIDPRDREELVSFALILDYLRSDKGVS